MRAKLLPWSLRRAGAAALAAAALLAGSPARAEQSLLNRKAPEFSRVDLHGARVDLAQYRGKVVLLNFWATWCAPCRLEMPRFVAWQKQYGRQGFQVVGVSIDDSQAPVGPLAAKMRLDYPVVMGNATLGGLYGGVYGVPVTFLIDRKGIVRARFDGGSEVGPIRAEMLKLLAEK